VAQVAHGDRPILAKMRATRNLARDRYHSELVIGDGDLAQRAAYDLQV
jgi:hypothetical protein